MRWQRWSRRADRLRVRVPRDKWTLGDHLFMARRSQNWDIETISQWSGINVNSLRKYERAGYAGGVYPPTQKLVTLCDFLKLAAADVFDGVRADTGGKRPPWEGWH